MRCVEQEAQQELYKHLRRGKKREGRKEFRGECEMLNRKKERKEAKEGRKEAREGRNEGRKGRKPGKEGNKEERKKRMNE